MANKIIQPDSMASLLEALRGAGKKVMVAGGTDVMIRMRANPPEEALIIDLSHMEALKSCDVNEEGLRIGAMCTMTELWESPLVQHAAKVLSCAASQVGSTQIRNRATIGGNVANAAQCADTIPALIALDASVELVKANGATRRIKVEDFVTGIGRTLIDETEAVTAFVIPNGNLGKAGGYCKIGSRASVTIAKVNCAGIFSFSGDVISEARVAFGSLGQRGFHSSLVSEGLTGMSLDALKTEAFIELFVQQVEQAIPGRASLAYKRSAVKAVAMSIVEQATSEYRG